MTFDDEIEALQAMILNSPHGYKAVAVFLFPHLSAPSAYARLKNCLNPERDERLAFGEIVRAMVFCDRFEPLYYACMMTGHAAPERKPPENIRKELADTIANATSVLALALDKFKSLDDAPKLRSVSHE